jgi:CheY-like chemotaxis protein
MPRILIVEDGSVASDNLRGVFASAGVEPIFVHSTTEALQLYADGEIDLVLTEVRMPVMDGIVLTRKLRQFDPDAAVICMTALERKDDLKRALREGVFDFFVKPFAASELTDCLRRAVAFRQRRGTRAAPGSPPTGPTLDPEEVAALAEREAAVAEREAQLERAVIEFEAMEMGVGGAENGPAGEEREAALEERETELEAREAALLEREALVEEREAFLEQSENALFEKGQRLQELETELEHRAEGMGVETGPASSQAALSPEAEADLEKRRADLDERERELEARFGTLLQREKRLKKNEALIRAREQYLKESENIIFESDGPE